VKNDAKSMFERCETLMLDMDGTLLDLAFDNFMWLHHVPERYADKYGITVQAAKADIYTRFKALRGTLDWYCLDHWSENLGLDILGLHRDENHRIAYLPGAERFLKELRKRDVRVLMVTNSHLDTLTVKDEVTGVREHFDRIYTSHEFGHPKEDQPFWHALQEEEGFDPATTLFVDDNHDVLESAATYGVEMLLTITSPDTSEPPQSCRHFTGVGAVGELL
jgi:putative hydrolase of the HAD superfamily